jgi:thiamine-monophosphate kinase
MSIFENTERTEVSQLGEFGLIDLIKKSFPLKNSSSLLGIGDDTAVLDYGNKKTLVTKDLLTEGIHFNLMYSPLKHLGYKAVAVNLSDICAMNAIPEHIAVGLAFSNRFSLDAIEELYEGIKLACERYNIDLIGGDTTSSASGLFISVTALGAADEDKICYRNGAQKGDLICVSGDLGGAYAGLLVLERERKVFEVDPNAKIDLTESEYVIERQLKPEPRVDIVKMLEELDIKPSSMIDISDGLASELLHICTQSGVGCRIMEDKVPIDYQTDEIMKEFGIPPITAALNGGEDYELLFTIKQDDYEKIKSRSEVSVIGYITEPNEGYQLITKDDKVFEITAQGWDHLKK